MAAIGTVLLFASDSNSAPVPQDFSDSLLAPWAVAVGMPAVSAAAVSVVMLTALGKLKIKI